MSQRLRTVLQRDASSDYFDDFYVWRSGDYTDTNDGGTGTVAVVVAAGAAGGWLNIPTAGAANDYHLLSTGKVIELVASKPVIAEIRLKITEAAANSAHFVFGFSDTLTGGFMADSTGEPPASWDGSVIYKPAGAAVLKHKTSNAGTATTTANVGTFTSGEIITLGLAFDPGDGTTGIIQPFVNGMGTKSNFDKLPAHRVALASLGPCHLIFGVKASTSSAETLSVDSIGFQATR